MGADTTAARARLVAENIRELLAAKPSGAQIRKKLSTLVAHAGYERASTSFLDALKQAFDGFGIFSDYAPNDRSLSASSWLRLALTPFPPTPQLFGNEKDLETFIEQSLGSPGRFANLDLVERQHRVGGHIIDILAKERTRRGGKPHLVVIEVKRNADEAVALQTLRYLDAVAADAPGTPVRAIIVTGPGGAAHYSTFTDHVSTKYEIEWLTYEVTFNVAVRTTPPESVHVSVSHG